MTDKKDNPWRSPAIKSGFLLFALLCFVSVSVFGQDPLNCNPDNPDSCPGGGVFGINGRITKPNGEGISDVKVELWRQHPQTLVWTYVRTATTNADGSYSHIGVYTYRFQLRPEPKKARYFKPAFGEVYISFFNPVVYITNLMGLNEIRSDFSGDRKSDVAVWRPGTGEWYPGGAAFGQNGDIPVPGDYDGDEKTDRAVYRPNDPNNGGNSVWYISRSSDNGFVAVPFGLPADTPTPGDYDGDGKTDISVFRSSAGDWYRLNSNNNTSSVIHFGQAGDKPVSGDYDGDIMTDIAVFRPGDGTWHIQSSLEGYKAFAFGASEDRPVQADYDGDLITDLAVFRPSTGTWWRINSFSGSTVVFQWGLATDVAAPADYDGDGVSDITVYRDGVWYIWESSASNANFAYFGLAGDVPVASKYLAPQ
jgi:hypothetical protein